MSSKADVLLDVDGDIWTRRGPDQWSVVGDDEPSTLDEVVKHWGPVIFLVKETEES